MPVSHATSPATADRQSPAYTRTPSLAEAVHRTGRSRHCQKSVWRDKRDMSSLRGFYDHFNSHHWVDKGYRLCKGLPNLRAARAMSGCWKYPNRKSCAGHVIVEVKAAGVCGTDLHIYHDEYPSFPPVILGHEVAGVVAEIGQGVTNCRTGDLVTCETYFSVCEKCEYCRAGLPNMCRSRKSIGSGVHGAFAALCACARAQRASPAAQCG